jgi:hypothetical protein
MGHGGRRFHVVIPSLPGYGFSSKPRETGWNPHRKGVGCCDGTPHTENTSPGRRVAQRRHGTDGGPGTSGHPWLHCLSSFNFPREQQFKPARPPIETSAATMSRRADWATSTRHAVSGAIVDALDECFGVWNGWRESEPSLPCCGAEWSANASEGSR